LLFAFFLGPLQAEWPAFFFFFFFLHRHLVQIRHLRMGSQNAPHTHMNRIPILQPARHPASGDAITPSPDSTDHLSGSLQSHAVQSHLGHVGVINRRLDLAGKELQFGGFRPAG